jgi:predicted PurR-regulated permease PerM
VKSPAERDQLRASLPGGLKAVMLLIILIGTVYGLIVTRNFLYPIAFAGLISYLLYPLVNFLEKKHFTRILAILIVILFSLVIMASIFFLFYSQLTRLFTNYEEIKSQVVSNIELLQKYLSSYLGIKDNGIEIFLKNQVEQFFGNANGGVRKAFTATTGTIFRIVILPVYTFLLLYYRTKFAYFILKIVPRESKYITLNILREISRVAGQYIGGVTLVVLILCVVNSTGLAIIGVEYAILLGIVSALFNFIPYFGTLMGGLAPFLFVLMTTDEPLYFGIRVALLFLLVQFTENYILTPNIVGGNVKINPLFIIIGLIAGGLIWGIPGMLVIIPFLAILKIIFSHIPALEPYAYLLGLKGTRKYAITFRKIKSALPKKKQK